ncbi:MAG: class SAM-dependent methyltransferase [Ilumatobacteraceae bacterium]|nr:class SAM-dependent methyltransferase [Ilumatobacteraceae bacterium]
MANEQMRAYWATGGKGWVEHRDLFDSELAAFADAVLAAADPGPGDRVLDIGCGTGILLAEATARGASGTGVDISPAMVEGARTHVPAATFAVADAQTDDLSEGGPFTKIISRFGVMFFDDPTAAFANIRRAAAPGADLVFVCWRGPDENPMFTMGTSVLLDRMDPPPPPPDPTAPGPSAFADRGRIESILTGSGWDDVAIEAFDALCDYGSEGSDGVDERLTMILNTGGGRMAQDQLEPALGADGWAALLDDVRTELRRHLVDGTLQFDGATWLVTARNPA